MTIKYNGEYKGTIINVNDPKGLGRVRIRVKGLFSEIPDAYLPWASQKQNHPKGSSSINKKGQKVYVSFLEGDVNFPVFEGGVVESKNDLPRNDKDGRTVIYESPTKGITLAVNESTGDIEIKTSKYNTTLNTLIDLFLSHNQMTPAGLSGSPATGTPPIVSLDFNKGDLT